MIGIAFRLAAGAHPVPLEKRCGSQMEWPPSPWIIMRALVVAATRMRFHPSSQPPALGSLVEALSLEPPLYTLPSGIELLHREARDHAARAVLRVARPAIFCVSWPHISLGSDELELFEQILAELPGVCSAEDWLRCEVLRELPHRVDARPVLASRAGESLDRHGMRVEWLCPLPSHVWSQASAHRSSVPEPFNLLEALARGDGIVASFAAHRVTYAIEGRSAHVSRRPRRSYRLLADRATVNAARYAIADGARPRITDALDISEVFHQSILSRYDDREAPAPLIITGHEPNEPGAVSRRGHQHVFVLPEDLDDDGFLDHVLIYAQEPFPEGVIAALERIRTLVTPDWWPGPKRRWRVSLEELWRVPGAGEGATLLPEDHLVGPARIFVSITPYLHPWHAKHGGAKFGPVEQIRKELKLRGLPEPVAITPRAAAHVAGQMVPAHKFRRLRYGKRQNIPGRWGSFWRLEFAEPVYGPIALGANCHFGMGLFAADADEVSGACSSTEDAEMT
ncbi:MAG: type I-U CRISPR-associated protein Cas5/Cas6 [Alicyclobacillus mali]|uniref:type I-G CRISPR-associated protein Csb2 n=1 Tax=Alicyclobacillus mali (ex Roth et al. 2021) TaxID=1123961 RepID=UPI0008307737|nr:type I-U CRISPR-associated protein Csb2 [Alicyclobacillus mali (ex Roth et al. 2021)]MCL6489647.1 type I-U CRISPR-associated protein Cas5/Cas6 [Alicyclobacillus mali (ex Roth et al. 2021)]